MMLAVRSSVRVVMGMDAAGLASMASTSSIMEESSAIARRHCRCRHNAFTMLRRTHQHQWYTSVEE